jgi:predicted transcriptional regulator
VAQGGPSDPPPGGVDSPRRAAGALEAEILAVLRAAAPLTPGQVRRRLAGPAQPSYSTVVTILSRLHAKGLLARERAGRAFAYTPVDDAGVAAGRMRQVLDTGADRDAVLTRFVSSLSGHDAQLLRHLLALPADEQD